MKRIVFFISILSLIFIGYIIAAQNKFTNSQSSNTKATKFATSNPTTNKSKISNPIKIEIEKINVEADVEYVGLDSENKMDVPRKAENVGWYNLGPKPGELGSAVIAGHLDAPDGSPAVFWDLSKLEKGDEIKIKDEEGNTYVFFVYEIKSYPFDNFPLQTVFADKSGKKLNLITCEGSFDKGTKNYSHRTVVYAEM